MRPTRLLQAVVPRHPIHFIVHQIQRILLQTGFIRLFVENPELDRLNDDFGVFCSDSEQALYFFPSAAKRRDLGDITF